MRLSRYLSRCCTAAAALAAVLLAACGPAQPLAPAPVGAPAEARIVSLVPSFTEILFAIGAQDRLVGVSSYCDYPPEAKELPRVGGYFDPNYEAIIALRPNIVLVSDYRGETKEHLAAFGIEVRAYSHNTIAEIVDDIRQIGTLTGRDAEADSVANALLARIEATRQATKDLPRERVLLSVGRDVSDTSMKEVYACGPVGFLNEVLEAAGGANALAPGAADYPVLTAEGILTLQPDRVFEILDDESAPQVADGTVMKAWASLPHFDLDERQRVHVFCNDYAGIPGPRVGRILDDFFAALHPELVKPPA